jgi:type I restriction enzyme S subunit
MSFPRYESYKDSGVEWLGEVPKHWEFKRLKQSHMLLTEKTDRRENPVALENIESWSGRFIQTETTFEGEGIAFERGDILFGKLRPYLAKVLLAKTAGEAVGDFHVMRPTKGTDSHFAQYQILNRAFIAIVDGSTFGAKMPRVSWDFLSGLVLTVPPTPEQRTIATFLDRETAKIDELIAEQKNLIELLKEKRQAVISHSVTKGLNPDAPMKHSGIEWLGEVPEHWSLQKLKHFTSFAGGGTPSRDNLKYWNGDIPWVSPKDMKTEVINGAEEYITQDGLENSSSSLRTAGRVLLVVRSGILKHTIPVAINEVPVALNQDMKALSFTDDSCLNVFFLRWVQGLNDLLLLVWAKQGATVESIEHTYLAETVVPLPPISEQQTITTFLNSEIAKLDTLTTEAKTVITLLQERRTALISAAVTGKIDVRGLVSFA